MPDLAVGQMIRQVGPNAEGLRASRPAADRDPTLQTDYQNRMWP